MIDRGPLSFQIGDPRLRVAAERFFPFLVRGERSIEPIKFGETANNRIPASPHRCQLMR